MVSDQSEKALVLCSCAAFPCAAELDAARSAVVLGEVLAPKYPQAPQSTLATVCMHNVILFGLVFVQTLNIQGLISF